MPICTRFFAAEVRQVSGMIPFCAVHFFVHLDSVAIAVAVDMDNADIAVDIL